MAAPLLALRRVQGLHTRAHPSQTDYPTTSFETHSTGAPTPLSSIPRSELGLIYFGRQYTQLVPALPSVPFNRSQVPSPIQGHVQPHAPQLGRWQLVR